MNEDHETRYISDQLNNLIEQQHHKIAFSKRIKAAAATTIAGFATAGFTAATASNFEQNHEYLGHVVDQYDQYFIKGGLAVGFGSLALGGAIVAQRAWQRINEPIVPIAQVDTADMIHSRINRIRSTTKKIIYSVVSTQAIINQHLTPQTHESTDGITEDDSHATLVSDSCLKDYDWYKQDKLNGPERFN